MLYARIQILCLFAVISASPQAAQAEFIKHGSRIIESRGHSYFALNADHALVGGKRTYGFIGQYPTPVLVRIFDERHDHFVGFGPGGDLALTVDESLHGDVEGALGTAQRLNVGGYEERVLCYASSRPGDDTVALFTLSKCPENCQRVSEIQVRAQKREVRVLPKCAQVPGVHAGIATESGLRLGLTGAQVEAILGPPQHIRKGLQGIMWFYAARVSVAMSREEATRRGFPGVEHVPVPGTRYSPEPVFDKHIVVWFRHERVSAWRVWLDWGL